MGGNGLPPEPFFIIVSDKRYNRRQIQSGCKAKRQGKRVKDMKHLYCWNQKENDPRNYGGQKDGFAVTEDACKGAGKEKGNAIPQGNKNEDARCTGMGNAEFVFNQRQDRRENGPLGKIHEPEKPDKNKEGQCPSC